MKYIIWAIAIGLPLLSSAQVYKLKAFQTKVATFDQNGTDTSDNQWLKENILVVINLNKMKVQSYGKKETDIDLIELTKDFYGEDSARVQIYNGVDEDGEKCKVTLIVFRPKPDVSHIANLVIEYKQVNTTLIFRLKNDQ